MLGHVGSPSSLKDSSGRTPTNTIWLTKICDRYAINPVVLCQKTRYCNFMLYACDTCTHVFAVSLCYTTYARNGIYCVINNDGS